MIELLVIKTIKEQTNVDSYNSVELNKYTNVLEENSDIHFHTI